MVERIAVIADDLTGALDTGVQFRIAGFTTQVVLPDQDVFGTTADVVIVDTETRNTSAEEEAASRVGVAAARLRAVGCTAFYKKIDSLLRGPWRAEFQALAAAVGAAEGWICPAFPAQGRVVRSGSVWVRHAEGAEQRIGAVLDAGDSALRLHVPDAETDADLDAIARRAWRKMPRPLLCGSAGLAAAWARELARHLPHLTPIPVPPQSPPLDAVKRVLVVAGSRSPETRAQVDAWRNSPDMGPEAGLVSLQQPPEELDGLEVGTRELVLLSAPPSAPEIPETVAVAEALGREAARLHTQAAFDALVLTGGETAFRVLRHLGVSGLELIDELTPGLPRCHAYDAAGRRLQVVTKSGSFGGPDLLAEVVRRLRGR